MAGSVVLIGGDPGIGKTTLLLQSLAAARGLNGVVITSYSIHYTKLYEDLMG